MNKLEFPNLFANIAASYARRELDRSVYDKLVATNVGQRLSSLDKNSKYALEFVAYSITAFAVRNNSDASAIRSFVHSVAADAPSELAKRVINGAPPVQPSQIKKVLAELSDEEISELLVEARTSRIDSETSFSSQSASEDNSRSAMAQLTEKIETSRRRMRNRGETKK